MASPQVQVRDRRTGRIAIETVFAEDLLRFLYEDLWGRRLCDTLLRKRWFSHLYGWYQRSSFSRKTIPEFAGKLGIDVTQATRPIESYRSLDDFFTRRLKPEARPIDRNSDHLVSPADGRVLVYPRVEGAITVKACRVSIAELVGDSAFEGGAAIVVRLAPPDYHRFHFSEAGIASASVARGRTLHSVHPIALEAGAPSFRNRRMISTLETESFGTLGLIEVGALGVGTMVQTYRPGRVERGQEKGYFRFGGSTVVLLIPSGRVKLDDDLVESSACGIESFVTMGSRIGRRVH